MVFDEKDLVLRKMEIDDIPTIASWNIQLHIDEGSIPLTLDKAQSRYRDWLKTNKYSGLVFSIANIMCGYILFENRPAGNDVRSPASIYVRQFFIDEPYRRFGIGSKAFREFQKTCIPNGLKINLEANISNPNAQKFWESLGFQVCEIAYELTNN